MNWCLYLLECADGSLYAGITNDLEKRVAAHNRGTGSRYTRARLPVKILVSKPYANRSEASRAEAAVKKLPRQKKIGFFNENES